LSEDNQGRRDLVERISIWVGIHLGLRRPASYLAWRVRFGTVRTIKRVLVDIYIHWIPFVVDLRGPRTIKVNGAYLTMMPNDFGMSMRLKALGNHEPLGAKLVASALQRGMICIDVGANIGFYAVLEGKIVGRGGKVIAVEPSPESYRYLVRNLSQNGINFDAYNVAISGVDGEVRFRVDRQRSNSSRVADESDLGETVGVQALTLDSLVSRLHLDRVDLIRMDVEGHEVEVSRGWQETVRRHKPMMFIEFHRRIGTQGIADILSFLAEGGYDRASYIQRRVNEPLIARMEDIQVTSIAELLRMLKPGQSFSPDFHLFAWPEQARI
jgi:FkbM family methyltransferase